MYARNKFLHIHVVFRNACRIRRNTILYSRTMAISFRAVRFSLERCQKLTNLFEERYIICIAVNPIHQSLHGTVTDCAQDTISLSPRNFDFDRPVPKILHLWRISNVALTAAIRDLSQQSPNNINHLCNADNILITGDKTIY